MILSFTECVVIAWIYGQCPEATDRSVAGPVGYFFNVAKSS